MVTSEAQKPDSETLADIAAQLGLEHTAILTERPAVQPSLPSFARWCQPGDMQDAQRFLIKFEDPDCNDRVFTDWKQASEFFGRASLSWNCWLFAAVPVVDGRPVDPSVVDRLRQDLAALSEWKAAIIELCRAIGSDEMSWGGDKTGWGFIHFFVKHLHTRATGLEDDKERLDWLDAVNQHTNERNRTVYGWRYEINHNRAALTDHNLPALTIREAIDAARFPDKAMAITLGSEKERARRARTALSKEPAK